MTRPTGFYRPPTKQRLIAHLAEFHTDALRGLAPALDEAPSAEATLQAALRPMPKVDLEDLHRLTHLGIGR